MERDEPIIICEVLKAGETEKYLQALLESFNYKCFWISSQGLIEKEQIEGQENYKEANYLFISESKVDEVMKQIL